MTWLKTLVLCIALLALSGGARANELAGSLPLVDDLSQDAAAAKRDGLIIVLISSLPDCFYCEYVKESHLEPMLANGELEGVALVREIQLAGERITDFDGSRADPADVANRYSGNFSPTVMFLSPDGKALHEPIVGVQSRDFYSHYLEKAIAVAHRSVRILPPTR